MRYTSPGQHKSVTAFRAHWKGLDPSFDCVDEPSGARGPLGRELHVADRRLENRFAIQPMEGWDGTSEGLPSELTLRRWQRFGASGAALIWGGEAVAVRADGRANPHQLTFEEQHAERSFQRLRAALRAGRAEIGADESGTLVGLQLTHSGRFARPAGVLAPSLAEHIPLLDRRFGVNPAQPLLGDAELEAIGERFVRAAVHASRAGFDFVDVKCCHGYLLHELLGARTRPGAYGGCFENRTRLFRRIVEGIRRDAPGLALGVRLSLADLLPYERDPESGVGRPLDARAQLPYRHGLGLDAEHPERFDLDEPLRFLALLRELRILLVNLSLGSPYYCPHLQRPAAYPPSDGYLPPEDPLASVQTHLRLTRLAKRAAPDLVLVGSGYSYLQEWLPHVAEHELGAGHVDCVGLGRMALSYPDLPRDVLAGRTLHKKRICRTFSDCTTAPRNGLVSGCYPLDPLYRDRPEAEVVRKLRSAGRKEQGPK